jgi:hypothetical protein
VAIAEDNLHDNHIIEASVEQPAERIRNAHSGRIGEKWEGDADDHRRTDRVILGGALSEAVAYWKDGSGV